MIEILSFSLPSFLYKEKKKTYLKLKRKKENDRRTTWQRLWKCCSKRKWLWGRSIKLSTFQERKYPFCFAVLANAFKSFVPFERFFIDVVNYINFKIYYLTRCLILDDNVWYVTNYDYHMYEIMIKFEGNDLYSLIEHRFLFSKVFQKLVKL